MTMSKEQNVDACEISPTQGASSFRELYDDMQKTRTGFASSVVHAARLPSSMER